MVSNQNFGAVTEFWWLVEHVLIDHMEGVLPVIDNFLSVSQNTEDARFSHALAQEHCI